jgi:hypothetical protein
MTTSGKILGAIALILLISAGALALPPIKQRLLAAAVTVNLLIPEGAWRPLQLLTRQPTRYDDPIASLSGRQLTIRMYSPAQPVASQTQTGMVIYTPFIGGGLDDPRLVNLAETFARAGFVVAVPWRESEVLTVNRNDKEDVISTILFLQKSVITPENQLVPIERIGLFGISYGNGPVVAAVADKRVRQMVPFIISLNGYYDLTHAIEFIRTGQYSYRDIIESRQSDPYTREVLVNTLAAYQYDDLDSFLVSAEFAELHQTLSPSQLIGQLDTEVFIIHSTDDTYIPYTESLHFRDAVSGQLPVTFALTDVISHGTYRPFTVANLQRYYLPAVRDFYRLVLQLLLHHQ